MCPSGAFTWVKQAPQTASSNGGFNLCSPHMTELLQCAKDRKLCLDPFGKGCRIYKDAIPNFVRAGGNVPSSVLADKCSTCRLADRTKADLRRTTGGAKPAGVGPSGSNNRGRGGRGRGHGLGRATTPRGGRGA